MKLIALASVLGALIVTSITYAQGFRWPDEPENMQVLPESAKGRALGQIMRGFAGALDVRCDHCHVGEGNDLSKYDFASDEKVAKQKARLMIQMVTEINNQHLPKLDDVESRTEPELQVECRTCHRRNQRPEMLDDMLRATIESEGVDAAVSQYKSLRDEYYGGYTYDFRAGMLTGMGEQYSRARDTGTALRLIELDIEMNGETAFVLYQLGQTQKFSGMREDALDSFTRGLEMAEDDWKAFFQAEIDKLSQRQN